MKLRIKGDQMLTKTLKLKTLNLASQLFELKSLSTLPKSTSVEMETQPLSTNCKDYGKLKYKKGHLTDH